MTLIVWTNLLRSVTKTVTENDTFIITFTFYCILITWVSRVKQFQIKYLLLTWNLSIVLIEITLTYFLFRAGWMRYMIMTQKSTTQLWLTPCLLPWRAPVSAWTRRVPTLAGGPHTMREFLRPRLSSHAPFSLQRAKYVDCPSNRVKGLFVLYLRLLYFL